MGKTKKPKTPPLPPEEKEADLAAEREREAEMLRLREMRGRASTILSGARGDRSTAPVYVQRLSGA